MITQKKLDRNLYRQAYRQKIQVEEIAYRNMSICERAAFFSIIDFTLLTILAYNWLLLSVINTMKPFMTLLRSPYSSLFMVSNKKTMVLFIAVSNRKRYLLSQFRTEIRALHSSQFEQETMTFVILVSNRNTNLLFIVVRR